ncbi:MAG: hypothetical protein H7318_14640 [Oligoflexus sp.]|nr:hypothetical protein [Oligoflexus sp.]
MNIRYILLAVLSLSACSRDRPKKISHDSGADKYIGPAPAEDSIPEESPLRIRSEVGSNLRFADGNALSQIYARIFPLRTYGFETCKTQKLANRFDCFETIFIGDERPFMGMVDLHSPQFGRGPQNIRRPEDMTLNYIRTLRVALGRECDNLVRTETKNFMEGKPELNLLVKAEKPSQAVLEEFFRKIIGIEGTAMPVSFGVEGYLAAFDEYLAVKADADMRLKAYFGLCLSIAMDPQVFLY